jgi:eukaryotic-like serine/threonine-protein kinase
VSRVRASGCAALIPHQGPEEDLFSGVSTMTQVPERIGQYEIESRLGGGGMGTVYRARHITLGRLDAVKLMLDLATPEARERFAREARAAASLNHPNIVTVYDFGEHEGVPYIAMELVEGETLHDLIRRKADVPLAAKLAWLEALCAGLAMAHAAGIVHRDLKPRNLMVNVAGVLKILDFGIARVSGQTMTVVGTTTGTAGYMSPEQIEGLVVVDGRSDLFAVGAVAYALLAMNEAGPFPGDSYHAILHGVLNREPLPLPDLGVSVGPDLDRIIRCALAKDVDARYQTAAELGSAFEAMRTALAQSGESVAPSTWADVAQDTTRVVPPRRGERTEEGTEPPWDPTRLRTATGVPPPGPVKRDWRGGALVVAAVVLIALSAGIGWLLWPSSSPSPRTTVRLNDAPNPSSPPEPVVPLPAPSPSAPPIPVDRSPVQPSRDNPSAPPAVSRPVSAPSTATPVPSASPVPKSETSAKPPTASTLFYEGKEPGATNDTPVHAGVKYRVLQRLESGEEVEARADTTFRSGDRVRFAFESNVDGFLYVVLEGSSGRWTVLLPSPDIAGGRNAVTAFKEHLVPEDSWFRFDTTPGAERVFIFLSKAAVSRLPGLDRPVAPGETLARAEGLNLVGSVRPRDLILERTNAISGTTGQPGYGNYVVNRDELASGVTTTFELTHK